MKFRKELESVEERFVSIEQQLGDPAVIANRELFLNLGKERAAMEETVEVFRRFRAVEQSLHENEQILQGSDEELKEIAAEEVDEQRAEMERLTDTLRFLLLPKDPRDDKSVILEIRAGTGGDESSLFAADLYRMYSRYAEKQGWTVQDISAHPTEMGGFKEVIAEVSGRGVFGKLRFESGVHRVQRVPETESQGRIHTSAVTVAVMAQPDAVDVEIRTEDLKIDTYRAGGAGGQHVNTTDSAVRITHVPTGFVVSCQNERSQHQNRARAMDILRARLYEFIQEEQQKVIAQDRKSKVGSGDRSERIRTYNFPQGRVTDHRIGLTLYKLPEIMMGDLDEVIEALRNDYQAHLLMGEGA